MKQNNETQENSTDEKFGGVLSHAHPRPLPPSARKEQIFAELRNEWLEQRADHKRTRRFFVGSFAASLLVTAVAIHQFDLISNSPVLQPDALLVHAIGSGTTVNGQPLERQIPTNAALRLQQGDSISTGTNAALAIAWNTSGSLRISSSSSLTIAGNDQIDLTAGEIYYDSRSHDLGGSSPIIVETPYGPIHHVGTQFLTAVSATGVRVSVREGRVLFGSGANPIVITAGQSAFIDRALDARFSSINATDSLWDWVPAIAPRLDVDGRSTLDVIHWLSHEMGLAIEFEDASAENYAAKDILRGIGEIGPMRAMNMIPMATDLQFDVDPQAIRIKMKAR